MPRLVFSLAVLLLPGLLRAQSRAANPQAADDKGTYLGILFGPVPSATPGVQITHVLPDSPAAHAGLRRNDVLVEFDGQKVRGCDHLSGLIRDDKPERKVKLALVRDGKPLNAEATLTLGPALLLPGEAKSAPVGSITVAAKPLPDGKMRVKVDYLAATGKPQSLVCEGSTGSIDDALKQLPERERLLVQKALERIRLLNTEKPSKPDDEKR